MHCINGSVRLSITKAFGRCLSTANSRTKLFVGGLLFQLFWLAVRVLFIYSFEVSESQGLSYDTNETVLKQAFGQHGEIVEVKVICNHVSGISRGYGFVRFTSEAAASAAIKEMDGQLLDGRNIRVHYAHKG